MQSKEQSIRAAIIESCLSMATLGINQGTSGNISVRCGDDILITPSGLPYQQMSPSDIVRLHPDGSYDGRLSPSSEWRFHRDIMAERSEVNAVVHAHPTYATSLAICRREIPAVHYMIAAAGGPNIRCSDYATFGTAELSRTVLQALQGRNGCLLANHGMIATGPDLVRAMWLAVEIENLARQYTISLSIGDPRVLSEEEIEKNIALFRNYGPGSDAADR